MLRLNSCFCFCFVRLCMMNFSSVYGSVLVANSSILRQTATPGFLRAGASHVNWANFATLSLVCNYFDMWTAGSSCLGFLSRQGSWHPRQCQLLSMVI
jgi:hypothetical protein